MDIGGTNIRCAIFINKQDPVEIKKISTIHKDQTPMERVISIVAELWPSDHKVSGIAAAVPGSVNVNEGIVLLAPNISSWRNIEFTKSLSEKFGVPVFVNNDARLAAIGEWKRGAGIGHENLLYFTISTGLGGGAIVHGRVLEGDIGIATESGHITIDENGPVCGCGKNGHMESFSSGTGIERFVQRKIEEGFSSKLKTIPDIKASNIAEAARAGDQLAIKAFERAGYYLGIGIANYLHIFNPTCVIFGGGVTLASDLWKDSFHRSLEAHVINPLYLKKLEIKLAALGDNVGLIGAFEYLKSKLGE